MPRYKLDQALTMTTGWGDTVALEQGTQVEVVDARAGRVEVLDGTHRGRIGVVPPIHLLPSDGVMSKWVNWQCADLSFGVRVEVLRALEMSMAELGTKLIAALNHALNVKDVDTGNDLLGVNDSAKSVQQTFTNSTGTDHVLLFRFYSGVSETLLPPCAQKPVAGREESSQPSRLPEEKVINPASLLRSKMHTIGRAQGLASSSASREVAHAHQEGHQALSNFVSCGYHLPRLLRTASTKVRIIVFGSQCGESLTGYAQATHLGFFLVPRSKLGDIIWKKGEMACMEREITFKGEGLESYRLFTIVNPFHPRSHHATAQLQSVTFKYF